MAASPRTSRPATSDGAGLFEGFEGYRTPGHDAFRSVFTDGIVAVDANVLLNLYRYTEQARDDLLAVLESLGTRLWVPHQVIYEFWRNRESVLRDPRGTERAIQELTGARDKATGTVRAWANRVSLPPERLRELIEGLTASFSTSIDGVDAFSDRSGERAARDTGTDVVLTRLEAVLSGRVGPAMGSEAHADAVAEAQRRVEALLPPGYMDRSKDGTNATGDYLVWEQMLAEASHRRSEVVFVTGDVKEDWWRRERGELRGPRLELIAEMRERTGRHLYMLTPSQLLRTARAVLHIEIHEESVETAQRVDRLLSESAQDAAGGGWTVDAIVELLEQLTSEGSPQADVIHSAASSDGFVSREEVYEIAGFDPARSLRGFTRPLTRLRQRLVDEHKIPETSCDLLFAEYDGFAENPSMAVGFRIDGGVLPLVIEALSDGS